MANDKAIFHDEDCDSKTPDTDLLESQPGCLKCGQAQRMMKCCTRCHSAFYCSKACFARHWPVHKESCQPHRRGEHSQQQSGMERSEGGKTMYRVIQHQKPTASPAINFQKAADALADKSAHPPTPRPVVTAPQPSSDNNNTQSSTLTPQANDNTADTDTDLPGVSVTLRYNKHKHSFKVCDAWDGATIFPKISTRLCCLPDTMRVIHKGRQLSADTMRGAVRPGAVFQVLAEAMEDTSGLVTKDIDMLMEQMGVERNVAVRALRQCGGDLIDAMMVIGNK